jgi:hypothetical protein
MLRLSKKALLTFYYRLLPVHLLLSVPAYDRLSLSFRCAVRSPPLQCHIVKSSSFLSLLVGLLSASSGE